MKAFTLDFRMVRRTLEMMRYTGAVESTLASGEFGRATVSLRAQQGTIQSYLVITANGQQITDKKRIEEELARLGLLEWRIIPFATTKADGTSFPSWAEPMPASSLLPSYKDPAEQPTGLSTADLLQLSPTSYTRALAANAERIALWPLAYQQVYTLSTGRNSEQDLGRMLRYRPTDLLRILRDLEQLGVLLRGV